VDKRSARRVNNLLWVPNTHLNIPYLDQVQCVGRGIQLASWRSGTIGYKIISDQIRQSKYIVCRLLIWNLTNRQQTVSFGLPSFASIAVNISCCCYNCDPCMSLQEKSVSCRVQLIQGIEKRPEICFENSTILKWYKLYVSSIVWIASSIIVSNSIRRKLIWWYNKPAGQGNSQNNYIKGNQR